jgi:hypothetical protein
MIKVLSPVDIPMISTINPPVINQGPSFSRISHGGFKLNGIDSRNHGSSSSFKK